MDRLIELAGNGAAVVGIVVCAIAGAVRLSGSFYVMSYEGKTLFLAGIALMVMACLAKLHLLSLRR